MVFQTIFYLFLLHGFSLDLESQVAAQKRYDEVMQLAGGERLLSGSDDFTLFLWKPLVP